MEVPLTKLSKMTSGETQKETKELAVSNDKAIVFGVAEPVRRFAGRVKRDESGKIVKKEGVARVKKQKTSSKINGGHAGSAAAKREDSDRVVVKTTDGVRRKKNRTTPKIRVGSSKSVSEGKVQSSVIPIQNDAVFIMAEDGAGFMVYQPSTGKLKETVSAEFKAGIERMALYNAKSKALFATYMKGGHESEFTGALAGDTRKNRVKKKDKHHDSSEIKKAH